MGSRLTISPPGDYVLARDVCSYGYFVLAPNRWDVDKRVLGRTLELSDGPARVVVGQQGGKRGGRGGRLVAEADRALGRGEQIEAKAQLSRMLRLGEDEAHTRAFHRVDPRWKRTGRSRLLRSPTLFEDVIKTVTSCNVTWPSTVRMNASLCEVCGKGISGERSFPGPAKLRRTRVQTLRSRCGVGYRDVRIKALAELFAPKGKSGRAEVDVPWLEDHSVDDDEVFAFLLTLPGIGPYAAGNVMQLLGRYSRLALDTESLRHGRKVLGMEGTDREVLKRLGAHYEGFGSFKFKSYWFELWHFYETKQGPSEGWDREETASAFTASKLNQ